MIPSCKISQEDIQKISRYSRTRFEKIRRIAYTEILPRGQDLKFEVWKKWKLISGHEVQGERKEEREQARTSKCIKNIHKCFKIVSKQ